MRVVVTGAAGLTGGEVARVLVGAGHSVVGIVRRPEQRAELPQGVESEVADCRDTERMTVVLGRADALVHVAGILLGEDLARVPSLRVPRSVVVVSTAGIYSAHRASAAAYRRNEEALRIGREDVVLVRPTMIYGSARDRNVHHVIRIAHRYGVLPLIGRDDELLQPIHYADLAVAITVLVGGGAAASPIDAGGAAPITLRAATEAIFAALGRPARFVRVPRGPALVAARALDVVRGSRWAERIERLAEDRSVDIGPFVAATGVRPRDFPTGVREEVAAMFAPRPG